MPENVTTSAEMGRRYLSHEELQAEALKLLLRFDEFCQGHDLHYSLDYGTLLGAVRHKGFIPWDDDIDISMARPDLERLYALEDQLPDDMRILRLPTAPLAYAFPKVMTSAVRSQEPSYQGAMEEYLWIDIFPMDGVPVDARGLERRWRWAKRTQRRLAWCTLPGAGAWWKQAVKRTVAFANRGRDVRAETEAAFSRELTVENYEASGRVAPLLCLQKRAWSLDRAAYEQTVYLQFEGHQLPAMACWREQLTGAYGDYMELPPESERQTHEVLAWRVSEEVDG